MVLAAPTGTDRTSTGASSTSTTVSMARSFRLSVTAGRNRMVISGGSAGGYTTSLRRVPQGVRWRRQ